MMLDMGMTELVKEGGFAFAALLMAGLVYLLVRQNNKHMDERGAWVDKLLTRLEATEQEHKAHSDHLLTISTALHESAQTMNQMLLAVTKMNGRKD